MASESTGAQDEKVAGSTYLVVEIGMKPDDLEPHDSGRCVEGLDGYKTLHVPATLINGRVTNTMGGKLLRIGPRHFFTTPRCRRVWLADPADATRLAPGLRRPTARSRAVRTQVRPPAPDYDAESPNSGCPEGRRRIRLPIRLSRSQHASTWGAMRQASVDAGRSATGFENTASRVGDAAREAKVLF